MLFHMDSQFCEPTPSIVMIFIRISKAHQSALLSEVGCRLFTVRSKHNQPNNRVWIEHCHSLS